jgi:hypothetical protein
MIRPLPTFANLANGTPAPPSLLPHATKSPCSCSYNLRFLALSAGNKSLLAAVWPAQALSHTSKAWLRLSVFSVVSSLVVSRRSYLLLLYCR